MTSLPANPAHHPVLRFSHVLIAGLVMTAMAPSSMAGDNINAPAAAENFNGCLARLETRAADRGIEAATLRATLPGIEQAQRVIKSDSAQPEFFYTFWHYLNRRVTEQRVERGREMLQQHYRLLHQVYREFGVRPEYLVAFWGLETNYGSYFGKIPVLDALATLACDQRRSEFFTGEFLTALELHQRGDMDLTRAKGSWAGAMGHTQFMPSTFERYALDHDGDGHRDLYGSLADAFASSANYLSSIGWAPGERWGREVIVPFRFDWSQASMNTKKTVSEWRALGLRDAFGRPLPESDMKGSLLLPMGHKGPAFLVYENFNIIMEWNRSLSYALAVGHLADRIAGMGELTAKRPEAIELLSRAEVTEIQSILNRLGYASGEPDGVVGRQTRKAAQRFQADAGLPADGYPDKTLLAALRQTAQ
ncbi:MAG: lytic murein transglycosylase [Gammaproteobacteria bacterium]|nr:lytic murein transglycosylase [Gammaproteobacteria bacterium]